MTNTSEGPEGPEGHIIRFVACGLQVVEVTKEITRTSFLASLSILSLPLSEYLFISFRSFHRLVSRISKGPIKVYIIPVTIILSLRFLIH